MISSEIQSNAASRDRVRQGRMQQPLQQVTVVKALPRISI